MDTQVPGAINPYEAVTYIDDSCATLLRSTRHIGSFVINLFGSEVYYKSNLQSTVSTSSTEYEFMATFSGAKAAKYISSVLE